MKFPGHSLIGKKHLHNLTEIQRYLRNSVSKIMGKKHFHNLTEIQRYLRNSINKIMGKKHFHNRNSKIFKEFYK